MLLKDYYRKTVDENDAQTGGWATFYYGVVSQIINDNNYKVVAEVGIGYGTHAKQLLRNTNLGMLYLIDPMKYYANDGFATDIMAQTPVIPRNQFNELHDLINLELAPYASRFMWFRKESLKITNEDIPSGILDCVFVDGDHTYAAVFADLHFWWEKVRKGGQMLGDDYWMEEVARAVHNFAEQKGLTVDFLSRPGTNYKIYRFHKN
jgi:hypothetical protein